MRNQSSKNIVHQIFHILLLIFGLALIGAFIFYFNYGRNMSLKIFGISLWILSAFLGWLPIYTFRKKGGVQKGESFVKTTKLVTTGIYSIIRHPQYLAGMLLGFSFMLISQHWLVLVLGIPFITIFYIAALDEDKTCLKKFGYSYREYIKKVPRTNLILGIIRFLFNKD
jgi:protein-S-isoprenylcysteine O-methyltransferase Ste14